MLDSFKEENNFELCLSALWTDHLKNKRSGYYLLHVCFATLPAHLQANGSGDSQMISWQRLV